jgi:dipeptidyl aminopeptidase/acylaminoacyl peptidase
VRWSPNDKKIVFTQTGRNSVDLYIIDVATHRASKINQKPLNTVLGTAASWLNNEVVLYNTIVSPASMAPQKPLMPKGPVVQQNLGKVAPSVTFEDLIKSPFDEQLFEFYSTSQLVANKAGIETAVGKPAIYKTVDLSPNLQYVLLQTIQKPFSYLVTAYGFPTDVFITDVNGKLVKMLVHLPSTESSPSGNDNEQDVDMGFNWRDDEAATLTWSHPLDSGLIKKKMDYHDAVYALSAPFSGDSTELFKTKMRFYDVTWGNKTLAVVYEGLQSKQQQGVSRYNPSAGSIETLYGRSTNDGYNDPGFPVTSKNEFGRYVIHPVDGGAKLLMNNTVGASPKGDLPFLAKFDLSTKKNEIIWRCDEGLHELIVRVVDPDKLVLLTRKESKTMVPNFYIKNLSDKAADHPVTNFANPYPQLDGVTHQKIFYKRADSVDLTGDLYLPKGYDKDKDGPLPVLIWAYPREFNSRADAAQVRGSQNLFITINWASPVFWVTQGYAVLDNAEMPIVAKGGKKPNDTFIEQLTLNAEAAINKLADMGVGDRNRVAVGGHSYGAFMTANLLAHTNLFKAGIARSGAYNRTLTPFGFQNEDRTYWDDPKLYYDMSPFSFANKIKTPLLLIHGDADDNTGTFPINSERLFNAVKGFGGTVRYVSLPYEAHGYRGRENLLHMLWEMNTWLNTYVKNAPATKVGDSGKQ